MNKFFFVYFSFFFLTGCVYGKPKRDNTYYAYKIVGEVIDEAKQKYNLEAGSVGGSFWEGVSLLRLGFVRQNTMDEEDAKAILLDLANSLVDRVNRHEKIRPFLRDYPFTKGNISISINFLNEDGRHVLNNELCKISTSQSKIYYDYFSEEKNNFVNYKTEIITKNEKTDINNE